MEEENKINDNETENVKAADDSAENIKKGDMIRADADEAVNEAEPANTVEEEDAPVKRRYTTQTGLTMRVVVGAYVLYLMYQVMTSGEEKTAFIYIMMVILTLAGAAVLVWSLKMLICGEYEGGKADKQGREAAEQEEVKEETVKKSQSIREITSKSFDDTEEKENNAEAEVSVTEE